MICYFLRHNSKISCRNIASPPRHKSCSWVVARFNNLNRTCNIAVAAVYYPIDINRRLGRHNLLRYKLAVWTYIYAVHKLMYAYSGGYKVDTFALQFTGTVTVFTSPVGMARDRGAMNAPIIKTTKDATADFIFDISIYQAIELSYYTSFAITVTGIAAARLYSTRIIRGRQVTERDTKIGLRLRKLLRSIRMLNFSCAMFLHARTYIYHYGWPVNRSMGTQLHNGIVALFHSGRERRGMEYP